MQTAIILTVFFLIIFTILIVLYSIVKKGRKNAAKIQSVFLSMSEYIAGKETLKIAQLHREATDNGIKLKGFLITPIIDRDER